MTELLQRLSSRKFLAAAALAALAIAQAWLGVITPDVALDAVKVAVLAYIGAEGAADVVSRIAVVKATPAAAPVPALAAVIDPSAAMP
jgi:hypothetical protein